MSTDTTDDLHNAEDRIGLLQSVILAYLAVRSEEQDDCDDWETRAEYLDWLNRLIEAEDAMRVAATTPYERPTCGDDCDNEFCGSPRHYDQEFNETTGEWEDT